MANLNIVEGYGLDKGSGSGIPVLRLPPLATQNRSLSAVSAQAAAFGLNTRIIRVQSDVDCFIAVGTNPTALTTDLPLAAGNSEYFGVVPGQILAARTA